MIKDIYIKKQANEPQPNIILLVFIFYIGNYSLTHLLTILFKIDSFVALCSNHPTAYTGIFFGIQFTFHLLAITYFMCQYKLALGLVRRKVGFKRITIAMLVLLPLVSWHFSHLSDFLVSLNNILDIPEPDLVIRLVSEGHNEIWSRLQYGTSLAGVVCSAFAFVAPCFEEMIITGFLVNYICRKKNVFWALAITPFCFSLMHILAFGFGIHLLFLLWAGYTYVLIRFLTGNIFFSIGAHLLVNFIIFIPKWTIAILYFLS